MTTYDLTRLDRHSRDLEEHERRIKAVEAQQVKLDERGDKQETAIAVQRERIWGLYLFLGVNFVLLGFVTFLAWQLVTYLRVPLL